MDKKKVILGSVILTSIIGVALLGSHLVKKRKEKIEAEKDEAVKGALEEAEKDKEQAIKEVTDQVKGQLTGKYAYPKSGKVNVRTSPEVDNKFPDNILYEDYNKKVGLIVDVVNDNSPRYGEDFKWYKVKLSEPKSGWFSDDEFGYVREDVVTVKNI